MEAERAIFEQNDEAAEAEALARAHADIEAGRLVPHAEVARWLATWGTPDEMPAPPEWLA